MLTTKFRVIIVLTVCAAACTGWLQAQTAQKPIVEFEMMTWQEVKKAIHEEGKVNAIVYNGGTEQRGPQNVNGGHNLMARETARAIALKLGHAIVAPVMPFSVNEASADLPGTIGLTGPIFAAVNERVAEQLITSGFKNVFLMGDHGGGQKEMEEVAKKLDAKYASQGIHIFFCGEMYEKAQGDYIAWLAANGYPEGAGGHAGVMDTSEMIYLGGDKGWVRKELISSAAKGPNNGIVGDARPSTPELGKRIFDMKVDYAVRQIQQFLRTAER
jgi:creatinine amidohydrolase/Fe(II)-dependent formamide hydrolase-like protein